MLAVLAVLPPMLAAAAVAVSDPQVAAATAARPFSDQAR
jgi:hypothetical protein